MDLRNSRTTRNSPPRPPRGFGPANGRDAAAVTALAALSGRARPSLLDESEVPSAARGQDARRQAEDLLAAIERNGGAALLSLWSRHQAMSSRNDTWS